MVSWGRSSRHGHGGPGSRSSHQQYRESRRTASACWIATVMDGRCEVVAGEAPWRGQASAGRSPRLQVRRSRCGAGTDKEQLASGGELEAIDFTTFHIPTTSSSSRQRDNNLQSSTWQYHSVPRHRLVHIYATPADEAPVMADPVSFAEEAAAAAPTESQPAPTFDGENKFQHAISVWRSKSGHRRSLRGERREQGRSWADTGQIST